jgi:hypothetical protein
MRSKALFLLAPILIASYVSEGQSKPPRKNKRMAYEEVDFEDLVKRYFGKERSDATEGIYSVSCVITQRNKRFLSKRERIRVMERKDNYARVAIIKDWPGSNRDYIEVSLSYRDAKKYPIVGELNLLSQGEGFIYKHIEPDGSPLSFSMVSESVEMLEAEYSDMEKRKTITYRLSYLKIFPKSSDLTVNKDQ